MSRVIEVVRRHQVVSFFVLVLFITFGISVPCLFLLGFDHPVSDVIQFCFVQLMLFSPVLSGIIISRLADTQRRESDSRTRWIVFLVAWGVAFVISWQTRFRYDNGTVEVVAAAIRASVPAFVLSLIFSNNVKLAKYLSTVLRPRGKLVWYLIALLAFPVIHVLGNSITWFIGGAPRQAGNADVLGVIVRTAVTFLSVLFFSGGLNEEAGWRGFALPRLQSRVSPLTACLVIWFFHVIWELPGDVIFTGASWPLVSRLIWMPSWSILFVWVYNRTGGSILAPMVFHASMNSMNSLSVLLPPTPAGTVILIAVALFAVVFDRMWRRLPSYSLAVHRVDT
jgi:membrane protease YdiL (CAAX protease family)